MGTADWDWRLAGDTQDYAWDCAACSTAWALRSIGLSYTEQDVIAGLGPGRIDPVYGLLDSSGAGLVEYLSEIGVSADHNPNASWQNVVDAAGYQPMVMGGAAWYHWTAVRMGPSPAPHALPMALWLMNPAPGWMGIDQYMVKKDFDLLGKFSAVWFTSWL